MTRPFDDCLVAGWLALEGLPPDFQVDVHPADDMYNVIAASPDVARGSERLCYLRSGQEAVLALENALESVGHSLGSALKVLEFACGYGRVTRHLKLHVGESALWTSDVVSDAVDFVQGTFRTHAFRSTTDPDTLVWPQRFTVVFVGSLFSHLPRHRFLSWLKKLKACLSEDGVVVFTTHGAALSIAPRAFDSGFAFVPRSESRSLDVAEYGSAFVAPSAVAQLAHEAGFAGLRVLEREVWMLQDLYVASVQPLRSQHTWTPASVLDGSICGLVSKTVGQVGVHGWTACRCLDDPVVRVTLHLDGAPVCDAVLGTTTVQDQIVPRPVRQVKSEWHWEGVIPKGIDGSHVLGVTGATRSGRHACVDVRRITVHDGTAELQ